MTRTIAVFLFFFSSLAHARSLTVDFQTLDYYSSSSTAVWNIVSQKAHLPFYITTPTVRTSIPTGGTISIGTGADGAFNVDTYVSFDVNQGATPNEVTLDTSRTYQFTTFVLPTGVTLRGQGSIPLEIYVLGDVTIDGTIDLSGGDGDAIDSDTSASPQGGTACCGGTVGGSGGNATTAATAGMGAATGGGGSGGAAPNGGGGAGHGSDGSSGVGPTSGGQSYGTVYVTTLLGGSGGGGGGEYLSGTALQNGAGGGGGGGGGAVLISSGGNLTISATGLIDVTGGAGGKTADLSRLAGAGGSGSGGSVVLLAAGLFTLEGTVDTRGAIASTTLQGRNGGAGSDGRTRIVAHTDQNGYLGSGQVWNWPAFSDYGIVTYSANDNFFVESSSIDSGNVSPTYRSITLDSTTPEGTSLTTQVAGSSDNFQSDDTGFVSADDLSSLDEKRYFKFRITLSSTNSTITPEVRSVTVTITDTFQFSIAGCARAIPAGQGGPFSLTLWFFLLLVPKGSRFLLGVKASRKENR